MTERTVTEANDLAYVRSQYHAVMIPDPNLPAPSYYDAAGSAYVPFDYEDQERSRTRFESRAQAEMQRLNASFDDGWLEEAWNSYWDGTFGICLRESTPENIVRKIRLMQTITLLLDAPYADEGWIERLGDAVNSLDSLERPFCSFDRVIAGRPVSRDTHIDDVRKRFPEIRPTKTE